MWEKNFYFKLLRKIFKLHPIGRLKVPQKTVPIEKEKEKKTRSPKPCSESSSQLITFSG
jgi:hypothetical protein